MDKKSTRELLISRRTNVAEIDQESEIIATKLLNLPEFISARTVFIYLNVRSEVKTHGIIAAALKDKRVAVPYPSGVTLEAYQIQSLSELEPGRFGIMEPNSYVRAMSERRVAPSEIDLAVVPGVGFDPSGYRLGYGAGFFDRFLPLLRPEALKLGLAFDCQIVERLPREEHDFRLGRVITPTAVLGA